MTASALKKIRRVIWVGSIHAHGALPAEDYQSFPIPVWLAGELHLAFLYTSSRVVVPLAGRQLFAPSYVGFVAADTARFEELRVFRGAEIGLATQEGELLGRVPDNDDWQRPEMLAKETRLYDAYDVLLPAFAAGPAAPLATDARRAASEMRAVFSELAEPPLFSYYQGLGRDFFAWLGRVS